MHAGGVVDTYESFVLEPALVKINAVTAATEAACLVCILPHPRACNRRCMIDSCLLAPILCAASCLAACSLK